MGKGKNCPFCGQDLKNAERIISAYRNYFDEKYQKYLNSLKTCYSEIKNWNIENILSGIDSDFNQACSHVKSWDGYLKEETDVPNISTEIGRLRQEGMEIKKRLKKKLKIN
ncbi:MAG: hypothetical protein H7A34_02260 [bacterium]|nr:hypothetical protein [bacterium]